ncbi:P-loop containing nucleoside triphosphate hydrolase protein [Xylariaceae sp. FL1272]|nr:P-loop containing nucleoside triphosphate hydrolase protein [Xylariaceae sp. FL1272]
MDILKILSRGAKKNAGQPFDLKPAAPKVQNPQLFQDKTLKRKRNEKEDDPFGRDAAAADEPSLDFFAPKEAKPPAKPVAVQQKPRHEPKPSLLDDDQVRQVLRSHRLKFTLLSSHDDQKSRVTKSKKKKIKEPVKAKAKDAKKVLFPQPLESFSQLRTAWKLSPRLEENLAKRGYRIPTEVQLGCLPLLIEPKTAISPSAATELGIETEKGIHLVAVAPTGSGKTLAFLVPAINEILRRRAEVTKDRVLETIIVAPTRELAEQITNEGRKLTKDIGVKIVMMRRGMRIAAETKENDESDKEGANSGSEGESDGSNDDDDDDDDDDDEQITATTVTKADVLVTTPLMLRNFLKTHALPTVRSLILDEADVLLEERFKEQTFGICQACTNPALRLRCFSATMGANIEEFITAMTEKLNSREQGNSTTPLVRLVVGLKDTAVPSISHKLLYCATEQGKLFALRQILHPQPTNTVVPSMNLPILVFMQTIERATALHDELKYDFPIEAGGSSRVAALHSSLSDTARSEIVRRFRCGEIWALITTDLLMRGLDMSVSGVVNYDVPTSAAAYVHRVGRTGRAGETGVACTLYTNDDIAYLKSIANVISMSEKQAGKSGDEGVPKWLLESLPKVSKDDKQKLKKRGVESRRANAAAKISTQTAWDRRRENNRRDAIASSKKRKLEGPDRDTQEDDEDDEWGGLDD